MVNTQSKTLLLPSCAHASSDSLGFWQCILCMWIQRVFFSNLISYTQIWYISTESILHVNYELSGVSCCPKGGIIFLKFTNLGLYNWQEAISVFFFKHETSCLTHHAWKHNRSIIPSSREQMHTVCSSKIYWYIGHALLQYLVIILISSVIAWLLNFLTCSQWETFAIPFRTALPT